jgi:hypothetical protein
MPSPSRGRGQVDPDHERAPSVDDYLDHENPLGPTTPEPFAPEALYELKIDTDGDAVADIAYRVRFSSSKAGVQTATLRQVPGNVLLDSAVNESAGRVLFKGERRVDLEDLKGFARWKDNDSSDWSLSIGAPRGIEKATPA